MRTSRKLWLLGSVIMLTLAVAGGVWAWQRQNRPPSFRGTVLHPPLPAPAFTLTDHNGALFRFAPGQKDATLLFFGYTFCPDVCPTTMAEFRRVIQELGPDADRAQFLFISVDPERDTPARLKEYVGRFSPRITGLTGSPEQIRQIVRDYNVVAEKVPISDSAAGYLVNHTASVFLVDAAGGRRVMFSLGTDPRDMARDVKTLLRSGQALLASDTCGVTAAAPADAVAAPIATPAAIRVENVWSRPAGGGMPGAGMHGGAVAKNAGPATGRTSAIYAVLRNSGSVPDALLAVRTDVAEVVELHETTIVNDVMRMQPVPRIEVPAGGQAELKRGGLHIMLFNVKQDLTAGQRFSAVLTFERAGEVPVEVEVRDP